MKRRDGKEEGFEERNGIERGRGTHIKKRNRKREREGGGGEWRY